LGAAFFDIDVATEPVVRAAMSALHLDPDDRDSPRFKSVFREPIYAALLQLAAENLPRLDVVMTGPFTRELRNENWLEELHAAVAIPCKIRVYSLYCDPAERYRRMQLRGNPRDASKLAAWNDHDGRYGEFEPPPFAHTAVDTGRPDALERLIADDLGQ